jgi:hypothetical protein
MRLISNFNKRCCCGCRVSAPGGVRLTSDRLPAANTSADGCCELLYSTSCHPKAEGGFVPTEGRSRASRGPAHRRRLSKFAQRQVRPCATWIARRPVPRLIEEKQMRGSVSGIVLRATPTASVQWQLVVMEYKTATVSRRSSFRTKRRAAGLLAWYFWMTKTGTFG